MGEGGGHEITCECRDWSIPQLRLMVKKEEQTFGFFLNLRKGDETSGLDIFTFSFSLSGFLNLN